MTKEDSFSWNRSIKEESNFEWKVRKVTSSFFCKMTSSGNKTFLQKLSFLILSDRCLTLLSTGHLKNWLFCQLVISTYINTRTSIVFEGLSETTGLSSDVYCQSMIIIFEHHALFKWNQYRWTSPGIKQRAQREREWDVAEWGERERTEVEKESVVGFKLRSALVDFDRWSKSTQSIFGYHKWPYQDKDILRQCK